jgi:hypothetical protein
MPIKINWKDLQKRIINWIEVEKVMSNWVQIRPTSTGATYSVTREETYDPNNFFIEYSDDATWLQQWSAVFDTFFNYSAVLLDSNWNEIKEVKQSSPWVLDITQLWTISGWNNVMIKFPRLWIKFERGGTWWKHLVKLSITKWDNVEWFQYYAHSRWSITNPTHRDCFYLWVYRWVKSNWVLKSWSGVTPEVITLADSITAARANDNNNWDSGYETMWFYQRQFINALYMMKYGNPDCINMVWQWNITTTLNNTWWTNSHTSATRWDPSNPYQCKLFWLEDLRWNAWEYSLSHYYSIWWDIMWWHVLWRKYLRTDVSNFIGSPAYNDYYSTGEYVNMYPTRWTIENAMLWKWVLFPNSTRSGGYYWWITEQTESWNIVYMAWGCYYYSDINHDTHQYGHLLSVVPEKWNTFGRLMYL